MANHKSAAKRARQAQRANSINSRTLGTIRTFEKKLRQAMDSKKTEEAKTLFLAFTSEVDKAAQKGRVHANMAARKISRLAQKLNGYLAKP